MHAGWRWPVLVTAALVVTVAANVVMYVAAGSDPNGTVVEPDYYRKAVEWDRTMARRAASERLGWRAAATLAPALESGRIVRVTVRDALEAPVTGAALTVTLIHNLEAATPVRGALRESAPGVYEATLPGARPGRWEVRVEAHRGDERFVATLHAEAP